MNPAIHGYTHAKRPPGVFDRNDIHGDTVLGCDVVIVGSGAGGATAAAELAEAGFDVIVLEEGSYWGTRDFTPHAADMIRKMYRSGGATAAIGRPPILYQEGRTVGGSSVVNGGMSWRTPEKILDKWESEDGLVGLRGAAMEPYFERVERRIHVAYQDPETIGRDAQIVKEGAEKLGWKYLHNLRNQLHCAGANNCAWGCPTGAKQSTLVTYIPRALHFGARIYSNVRVDRITHKGKRATGIVGRVLAANGSTTHTLTVRAKVVISACGSIHTPALLHRSGVKSPSGQLGKNLSMHPNTKVVAFFDEEVRGWEGVHQAYQVREFFDQGIMNLTAVNVPPSIVAMSLHHYGDALGDIMNGYKNAVIAGILCEDVSTGHIKFGPGGMPIPFYDLTDKDVDRLKRGTQLLCEMLLEAGAKRIILPFGGIGDIHTAEDAAKIARANIPRESMEVVTVHMMGTARMGSSRARSVTNQFGEVYDADRLFVCDASLFPSAVGVNPCETIQALSTRNAAYIIENRERFMQ